MNTIKIIDLLNKIANGEEVPKKIKFGDVLWIYNEENQDYLEYNKDDTILFGYVFYNLRTLDFINEEVEILDEEPKPITKESIEALGYACGEIKKCFENGWNKSLENKPLIEEPKKIEKIGYLNYCENQVEIILHKKIDEIIDEVNKLKENKYD